MIALKHASKILVFWGRAVPVFSSINNTTTMARNNTRKRAITTPPEPASNTPDSTIILGEEETPTAPLNVAMSAYPEEPLLDSQTSEPSSNNIQFDSQSSQGKIEQLS